MFKQFREWFWTDNFWLPYGFKWEDIKDCPLSGLYVTPFLAVGILLSRYLFERYVAINLCIYLGIPGSPRSTVCEKDSDSELSNNSTSENTNAPLLSRKNKRYTQVRNFRKATETCWRCFAYFILFVFGSVAIFRSDWFWHTDSWLLGYIRDQPFPEDLKWYYFVELSFYLALMATYFHDTKRKDHVQQLIHHVTTIILIAGSYMIAHFRYGSVIMLLHDASDMWLEAAKIARYAKWQKTCDALFVIFALVFYLTRWVYFPLGVILPWWRDNAKLSGPLDSYITFPYIFCYMCILLMGLHVYWGILIFRVIYKFVSSGDTGDDSRSDDDE